MHSSSKERLVMNLLTLVKVQNNVQSLRDYGLSARSVLIFSFNHMKWLRVFLLLLDGKLVHHRVTPSIKFTSTHLYTWVQKSTVRVKCPVSEHNTMSLVWAQTQTTWSKVSALTMRPLCLHNLTYQSSNCCHVRDNFSTTSLHSHDD